MVRITSPTYVYLGVCTSLKPCYFGARICKSPLRCVFLMYAILFTMNKYTHVISFSSFRPGSFKISWKTVTEEKTRKTSAFRMVMVWKTQLANVHPFVFRA